MNFKKPIFLLALLTACSAGSGEGKIFLSVKNAHGPEALALNQALPSLLQTESFRVVVSGPDFSPVERFFAGDATEGTIEGIPVGENREVLIEAINPQGRIVRRARLSGIKIGRGRPTPVVAILLSVPFVTNLAEGNLVTQTRLLFKGYAEPAGSLTIEDRSGGSDSVLYDLSSSLEVIIPSPPIGEFSFQPPLLPLGPHTFVIRDPESGEETELSLVLASPGREPGTGFQPAGQMAGSSLENLGRFAGFSELIEELRN